MVEMIDKEREDWQKGKYHTNIALGAISGLTTLKSKIIGNSK
jgi:hypothetical protein